MNFSQRIGLEPVEVPFQNKGMDIALRNSLWNTFFNYVFQLFKPNGFEQKKLDTFRYYYYVEIKKVPIHTKSDDYYVILANCHEYFDTAPWNKVYEFLEFFLDIKTFTNSYYINELNSVLERENSAYRVIDKVFAPIISEVEIESIQSASLQILYAGAKLHMNNALRAIAVKDNTDYAYVIKESISGVESVLRKITGENTLGSALNKIEKTGLPINNQMKEGFSKLYNYTNDSKTGIRHAVLDDQQHVNFDTAKFMLVASSAFINYVIAIAGGSSMK